MPSAAFAPANRPLCAATPLKMPTQSLGGQLTRPSTLLLLVLAFVAPCGALSLFRPLKTPDEFRRAMQKAEERDQLTVLAIKKPRCLACRAVAAPLDQLAERGRAGYPLEESSVRAPLSPETPLPKNPD